MRLRFLALLVGTTSCDIFAPGPARPVTIELPFCGQFAISLGWAAVKNEGSDWVYLAVTEGKASFTATSAFTVAYGNSSDTQVYSVTADEMRDISCPNLRTPEAKFLNGSVRDIAADERFYVTVGSSRLSSTPFTVFVPDGSLDVVARTENKNTALPQRIIVRHGVDLPTGSEIPILDFGSTEARPFESANMTANGIGSSTFFSNEFMMPSVRHSLASGVFGQSTRFYAVPSSLLGADDYHALNVRDFSNNTVRELVYYYRSARDAQVSLGPPASTPTGSVLSASPCTRLRARIPAQAEYGSFVIVHFQVNEGLAGNTVVEVGLTREFLGETPSTWTVDVPDLKRPDGSCLLSADRVFWSLYVTPQEGRIALHLGGKGRHGEVRRWATAAWPEP